MFVVVWSLSHVWTFCNPIDSSFPGSSVHRIFQERILDWVANSFSRASSWPSDWMTEFVTPALAGRFFITESPGQPHSNLNIYQRETSLPSLSPHFPSSVPSLSPSPFYLASFNVKLILFFACMINSNNKVTIQKGFLSNALCKVCWVRIMMLIFFSFLTKNTLS